MNSPVTQSSFDGKDIPLNGKVHPSRAVNLTEIIEDLTCGICLHIIQFAETISRCGHCFCFECFNIWKTYTQSNYDGDVPDSVGPPFTCPTCLVYDYKTQSAPLIDIMARKIKVTCRNKDNGCEEILENDGLFTHEPHCQYGENGVSFCDVCFEALSGPDRKDHSCIGHLQYRVNDINNKFDKMSKELKDTRGRLKYALRSISALKEKPKSDELKEAASNPPITWKADPQSSSGMSNGLASDKDAMFSAYLRYWRAYKGSGSGRRSPPLVPVSAFQFLDTEAMAKVLIDMKEGEDSSSDED